MKQVQQIQFWKAQDQFFKAGPQPIMFLGGVGSGKTWVGIIKLLYLLDLYPGSRGVIIRQRFAQLKKTTSATLWRLLSKDKIARRNDNEGSLTLTNGSQLLLMHLDKGDSLSNMKSLEINFAFVDQAEDISVEAWDTLWERIGRWGGATMRNGWPKDWPYRNRLGEPIPPRYLFANCYSPGFEHWITARFWEHGSERDRYAEQGYQVFVGSTRDNLALSEEYVQGRLAMGEEYVKRYVDAVNWGAKEGRIFDLSPISILDPHPEILRRIHNTMRLHRALDHGEAVPTAVSWYATDADQNVFFYREYGAAGMLVSDHRSAIYMMSKDDGGGTGEPPKYYTNIADPAIFAKNRGRSATSIPTWSVADEYADKRIIDSKTSISWRPAINDEAMTINRVREYMRVDPKHRHPLTGKLGAPRIYFIRKTTDYPFGCHEVLTDIRSAKREEVGVAPDGSKLYGDDRDKSVRDHWLDTVRYGIGMRPAIGLRAMQPDDEPGTLNFGNYMKLVSEAKMEERVEKRVKWRGNAQWGY